MFANQNNGQKSKLVKIAFQLFCVCLLSGVMQAGDMANPFDVCPHGVKTVVAAPANPAPKVSLSTPVRKYDDVLFGAFSDMILVSLAMGGVRPDAETKPILRSLD